MKKIEKFSTFIIPARRKSSTIGFANYGRTHINMKHISINIIRLLVSFSRSFAKNINS